MSDKLTIEIMLMVYNFQHRFCWQCSSILQQIGELPNIIVNAAYLADTGNPSTGNVLEYFKKYGLNVKHTRYELKEKNQFKYRGLNRTRQLLSSNADWILFSDPDHVFEPNFFAELYKTIKNMPLNQVGCFFSRNKITTDAKKTYEEVEKLEYPCVVDNCYDRAYKIENSTRNYHKIPAPGNCQISSMGCIKEKNDGIYCLNKSLDRPLFSKKNIFATGSDRFFRKKVGGSIKLNLPMQINMNHYRYGDLKYSIFEQR